MWRGRRGVEAICASGDSVLPGAVWEEKMAEEERAERSVEM